jgi:hypothetical protein
MPDQTVPPCDCKWLENAANDPHVPVVFDRDLNEYHITRGGELGGSMLIYHCPFCGGSAPKSARDELFATITHEEMHRLQELTRNIHTVPEMLAKLGTPDEDLQSGQGHTISAGDGEAPRTEFFRTLRYTQLSDSAVVDAVVYPPERVHFVFVAKHIGKDEG